MLISPENTSVSEVRLYFIHTPNWTRGEEALQAHSDFLCVWTVHCPLRKSLHSAVTLRRKGKRGSEWCSTEAVYGCGNC